MRLGILASAFDPFPHPGLIWAMQQAISAGQCDLIVAALHIDPSVERPEKRRPVLSVNERRGLLLAIRYVYEVETYHTESELSYLYRRRRPSVRIIGEDHRDQDYRTGDEIHDPLIPIFYAHRRPGWSGTDFMRRIGKQFSVNSLDALAEPTNL